MRTLELPHTAGCLVCGLDNPIGLHLSSCVNLATGSVETRFTPAAHHIGFDNIIHGGILATVADEIMVWAAIWASRKACVAAELSLRYLQKAVPAKPLHAVATITRHRSRLIETAAELRDGNTLICAAAAKYIPLGPAETAAFIQTFIPGPATEEAAAILKTAQG